MTHRARRLTAAAVLVIASLAASVAVLAAAQVITPGAFTDEVANALRARLMGARVTVSGSLELQASRESRIEWTLRVGTLFDTHRSRPGDMKRIISNCVETIAKSTPMRLAPSADAVLPVVRTRAWFDDTRTAEDAMRTVAVDRVTELIDRYGDGLVVAYVLDGTHVASALTPRTLQSLGIDRSLLHATATANLGRQYKQVYVQPGPSVTLVTAGGASTPRCCIWTLSGATATSSSMGIPSRSLAIMRSP